MREGSRWDDQRVPDDGGKAVGEGATIQDLLQRLTRQRRTLLTTTVAVVVAGLLVLLITGPRFSAESSFRPEVSDNRQSRFAGLAAQLNIPIPGAMVGDPVRFYAELAMSREVLTNVLTSPYVIHPRRGSPDSIVGDLVHLYKVTAPSREEAIQKTLKKLRRHVIVTTSRDAGLVYIKTVTRWPELSVAINRRILDLLASGYQQRRQSQAGAERRFLEGRLQEAREDLQTVETTLTAFLERNRRYQEAPKLLAEFARLQRRVDLRQEVYSGLAQSYEQARLDEVRDTPVLTTIDRPEGSGRRHGSFARDLLVWLFVGLVAGGLAALIRDGLWSPSPAEARHPGTALEESPSTPRASDGPAKLPSS